MRVCDFRRSREAEEWNEQSEQAVDGDVDGTETAKEQKRVFYTSLYVGLLGNGTWQRMRLARQGWRGCECATQKSLAARNKLSKFTAGSPAKSLTVKSVIYGKVG